MTISLTDPFTIRIDPFGLFLDGYNGNAGANDFKGHSDFFGSSCFDYTLEDHDPATWPWPGGNAAGHFQSRLVSEAQVNGAIHDCDEGAFERYMHRLQDFWSHYNKGYRWDPPFQLGHIRDRAKPDQDNAAWAQAEAATKQMVEKWNKKCPCKACFR
jgi:hypothetical protein